VCVCHRSKETGLPASVHVRVCNKSFNLHKVIMIIKSLSQEILFSTNTCSLVVFVNIMPYFFCLSFVESLVCKERIF